MHTSGITIEKLLRLSDEDLFKYAFPSDFADIVGKRYDVKQQTIRKWTKGQRSMFMFIAVYYHNINGWESFFNAYSDTFSCGFLDDLKSGLEHLGDKELLNIVKQCEYIYSWNNDNDSRKVQFEMLDREYEKVKDTSLRLATGYIRKHPQDFISLKE